MMTVPPSGTKQILQNDRVHTLEAGGGESDARRRHIAAGEAGAADPSPPVPGPSACKLGPAAAAIRCRTVASRATEERQLLRQQSSCDGCDCGSWMRPLLRLLRLLRLSGGGPSTCGSWPVARAMIRRST